MSWKIEITASAEKELAKLDKSNASTADRHRPRNRTCQAGVVCEVNVTFSGAYPILKGNNL
ncbi:type II toxin-antitoxin system RelE/ParE family toxin [Chlorobaculum sp. 24CR]|uniref:type II toxin-antitoxin system RelE family toxin n=1 Tax=Chlorobaculum sp. 24CR TaxID=2508878 RepID=UPI00100AF52E|nr:hypothetical protein [Chlorobaculum sp. 24CR]